MPRSCLLLPILFATLADAATAQDASKALAPKAPSIADELDVPGAKTRKADVVAKPPDSSPGEINREILTELRNIAAALNRLENRAPQQPPAYQPAVPQAPPAYQPVAQLPSMTGLGQIYVVPPIAPAPSQPANPTQPAAPSSRVEIGFTLIEIALVVAILAFSGAVMWMVMKLRLQGSISGISFFKLAGMSFVIAAGIVLIAAGYSQEQTAPVMSILAAIAGYIFGRNETGGDRDQRVDNPTQGSS